MYRRNAWNVASVCGTQTSTYKINAEMAEENHSLLTIALIQQILSFNMLTTLNQVPRIPSAAEYAQKARYLIEPTQAYL